MINRLLRLLAVALIALGTLWSLQGAGIVHVKPILCFADCAELQAPSLQWLITGLAVIVAGAISWYVAGVRTRR